MQQRYRPRPGDRVFRLPMARPWQVLLPLVPKPKTAAASSLVLIYGFASIIAVGAILLMLPVSSKGGQFISPMNAFFTATSAVCVTGLVVVDTANHWTPFGQAVLISLVQIGGFGFMTSATLILLAFGRRIGLKEKVLISESMGIARLGGLLKFVGLMALFTVLLEAAGAAGFYHYFSTEYGREESLWLAVFQSISAFNNAGFDLSGDFRSLSIFQSSPSILLVTAVLIVLGGISFLVVADLFRAKWRLPRLSLDSKLVLTTTALLLLIGTLVIFTTESGNSATLANLPLPMRLLNAFFLSVSARTAGFSTIDIGHLANYALFFIMILMFIGGASGSTAGGIKVNNFSMLVSTIWSSIRGREYPGAFSREFHPQQIYRALAVVLLSLVFVWAMVFLLTVTEGSRFIDLLFETISAFGTVGYSTGITPNLSLAGRLIIAITMFVGRLGPLTLTLALVQRQQITKYRYPKESVRIG